jgi:hypothetical protein
MSARTMSGSTTEQFHDQAEDCRSLAAKAPKGRGSVLLRLSDYGLELGDKAKRGALDKALSGQVLRRSINPPACSSRDMRSKVFTGKDKSHLESQIWNWMLSHPDIVITERHPIVGPVRDVVTRQIDYEE